jgi:hypothetical protein
MRSASEEVGAHPVDAAEHGDGSAPGRLEECGARLRDGLPELLDVGRRDGEPCVFVDHRVPDCGPALMPRRTGGSPPGRRPGAVPRCAAASRRPCRRLDVVTQDVDLVAAAVQGDQSRPPASGCRRPTAPSRRPRSGPRRTGERPGADGRGPRAENVDGEGTGLVQPGPRPEERSMKNVTSGGSSETELKEPTVPKRSLRTR